MSTTKMLIRSAKLAGAACLLVSTAALADSGSETKTDRKEIQRIIIVKEGDGKEHADRRVEAFRRDRDVAIAKCKGERSEIDERTETERTRIVVCADTLSSAERARHLEETLGRIRKDEHLSAEHKARVETALETAIARLRETR